MLRAKLKSFYDTDVFNRTKNIIVLLLLVIRETIIIHCNFLKLFDCMFLETSHQLTICS